MQHVAENLYKEAGKTEKKEDNLRDDFRKRLANKKKPNKKAYDFLKKVGRRLENDDKEPPNFAS
jgi:hypothetical protein